MTDYIIVGGGSAGCVLAKRLSENSGCQVTLLEAGPSDWNPFIHMPAGLGELLKHKWVNWYFDTAPEKQLGGRHLYWPRGKVLGGSSAMNGMIYIRGHKNDYDRWSELPGCEGWDYETVLPWFKRSENFVAGADDYHAEGGELGVSPTSLKHELFDAFDDAIGQSGLPRNADFNGEKQEGVGRYHVTIKEGVRQSAARCFLSPEVRQRPNLTIVTGARVCRLLLDGKRVSGVEYQKGKRREQLLAKREVLLCAGAVQSPQLLMLSGIGSREALAEHGIALQHELPGVGENLQDHLDVGVQYHCTKPVSFYKQTRLHRAALVLLRYLLTGKGLGRSNVVEWGGFLRTPLAGEEPDIQLHFVPTFTIDHTRDPGPGHGFMLHACQLRPHSRGRIRLASADPLAAPLIEPNYLSDARDLPVLIEAVKLCRRLLTQPAFDTYRGEGFMLSDDMRDDAAIGDYIRRTAETIYHPVGSCKMGAATDEMAVVDNQCRLHGLEGLRVVDASVFPLLMGGNTNAPTIMLAERVAAAIVGGSLVEPGSASAS